MSFTYCRERYQCCWRNCSATNIMLQQHAAIARCRITILQIPFFAASASCELHTGVSLQVYYEDLDNGDRMEAYCNLVHCYSLPADEGLWVEHGYFDDRYACRCCPVHGKHYDITTILWQYNIVLYGEADASAQYQQSMRPCACLLVTVLDISVHRCFATCEL